MNWSQASAYLKRHIRIDVITAFILGSLIFGVIGWFTPPPGIVQRYTGAVLFQSSNTNNYQYIDPLLTCEIGPQTAFSDLGQMKSAIDTLIDKHISAGDVTTASVYYRSLRTAHWFDINPDKTYAPASLLKVFVMMAYFKESRDLNDSNFLLKQIAYKGSPNPVQDDSPGANIPHLQNGQYYTIDDVIKQMIVYSDNDALNTLIANFDPQTTSSLQEIFSDLRINSPLTDSNSYFMTVDQYSMVFRVLYNSTYLNRRLSEKALSLLAQADFRNGLVSGLPQGVSMAHKFGVTTVPASSTTPVTEELHDCGIVYYPGNPYVLCVMTSGGNFTNLESTLKEISSIVYEEHGKMGK